MRAETGLVTISTWVDIFFEDPNNYLEPSSPNYFADRSDPLLQKHEFRVEVQGDHPDVITSEQTMSLEKISYMTLS